MGPARFRHRPVGGAATADAGTDGDARDEATTMESDKSGVRRRTGTAADRTGWSDRTGSGSSGTAARRTPPTSSEMT